MYANHLEAYKTVGKTTLSGRELEASVLTRAAIRIKECRSNWDAIDRDIRLSEALRNNQRIWSIFQGELVKDDNPLPKKLREDLLSLSVFVDKRTIDVMAYPEPEKLAILIDINLNLAAGLSAKTEGADEEAPKQAVVQASEQQAAVVPPAPPPPPRFPAGLTVEPPAPLPPPLLPAPPVGIPPTPLYPSKLSPLYPA